MRKALPDLAPYENEATNKAYIVGLKGFDHLQDAVDGACQSSENGGGATIIQNFYEGATGKRRAPVIIGYFIDGRDIWSRAEDKYGNIDVEARKSALIPRRSATEYVIKDIP